MKFDELDSQIRQWWNKGKSKAEILYVIINHVIIFLYELELEDL